MDNAKKKCTPLHTSFTINILKTEIEKDEVDKGIISNNFSIRKFNFRNKIT